MINSKFPTTHLLLKLLRKLRKKKKALKKAHKEIKRLTWERDNWRQRHEKLEEIYHGMYRSYLADVSQLTLQKELAEQEIRDIAANESKKQTQEALADGTIDESAPSRFSAVAHFFGFKRPRRTSERPSLESGGVGDRNGHHRSGQEVAGLSRKQKL